MEINHFKFIEGRSNTLVLLYPKYFHILTIKTTSKSDT